MATIYDSIDDFEEIALFKNISACDALVALERVEASLEHFAAGKRLFSDGQNFPKGCLYVINGRARSSTTDANGNRSILCDYERNSAISPTSQSCVGEFSQIEIIAIEPLDAISLPLDFKDNSAIAAQMEKNLVNALIESANKLLEHISIVSERNTRSKILAYLQSARQAANNETFEIPYSRQELADFLYVERSALSREISKLQEDGLIKYKRNTFTLLR